MYKCVIHIIDIKNTSNKSDLSGDLNDMKSPIQPERNHGYFNTYYLNHLFHIGIHNRSKQFQSIDTHDKYDLCNGLPQHTRPAFTKAHSDVHFEINTNILLCHSN